jgi:two-component system phosphate regulon sensor histidine kinase PhoR
LTWLLLGTLILGALVAWIRWRRFVQRMKELESMVDELIAGEIPATFIFRRTPHFSRVARKLDTLSDAHARLQRQIKQEKFNFEAVLASMSEGVLVTDAEHVIRLVNRSFREMFHLPAAPLGQSVLSALRDLTIDQIFRDALEQGDVKSRELSIARGASQTIHFEVNAVPLQDAAGEVSGVVAVFHDTSRVRQLEQVRREFVANVSHELRTPLSIFHGYLENLLDCPEMPPNELTDVLQIMDKHSRRLQAMLNDLLILARLESRAEKLDLQEIALGPFVKCFVEEWRPRLAPKKLRVDISIGAELPALRADPSRFEQVLGNLLDNAIKFSPAESSIRINAAERDGQIEIRVEDQGSGIPSADLPHIFERFYRVEKARTRAAGDVGGTGLGLSIVKHIVALHGGNVSAQSVFGKGTTIIISLPRG